MKNSSIDTILLDKKISNTVRRVTCEIIENQSHQKASLGKLLASKRIPTGLSFLERKFKLLLGYLILLHYYPVDENLICYFYLDLQEHLNTVESFWLSVLSENKDLFLKWLVEQETITEQAFFSGICSKDILVNLISTIVLQFEEKFKRPRELVRRKGYRDKGSLADPDLRALKQEIREDYYLQLYQNEIEAKRAVHSELKNLLRAHLNEGRGLTERQMMEFRLIPRRKGEFYERKTEGQDHCKQRAPYEFEKEKKKPREADQ